MHAGNLQAFTYISMNAFQILLCSISGIPALDLVSKSCKIVQWFCDIDQYPLGTQNIVTLDFAFKFTYLKTSHLQ